MKFFVVWEVSNFFIDFTTEKFSRNTHSHLADRQYESHRPYRALIMARLRDRCHLRREVSLPPYGAHRALRASSCRRTDKSLWIFFINQSLTESMKCLNIDAECICTDKAPKSFSHGKRSRFRIGEREDISGCHICFCGNLRCGG